MDPNPYESPLGTQEQPGRPFPWFQVLPVVYWSGAIVAYGVFDHLTAGTLHIDTIGGAVISICLYASAVVVFFILKWAFGLPQPGPDKPA